MKRLLNPLPLNVIFPTKDYDVCLDFKKSKSEVHEQISKVNECSKLYIDFATSEIEEMIDKILSRRWDVRVLTLKVYLDGDYVRLWSRYTNLKTLIIMGDNQRKRYVELAIKSINKLEFPNLTNLSLPDLDLSKDDGIYLINFIRNSNLRVLELGMCYVNDGIFMHDNFGNMIVEAVLESQIQKLTLTLGNSWNQLEPRVKEIVNHSLKCLTINYFDSNDAAITELITFSRALFLEINFMNGATVLFSEMSEALIQNSTIQYFKIFCDKFYYPRYDRKSRIVCEKYRKAFGSEIATIIEGTRTLKCLDITSQDSEVNIMPIIDALCHNKSIECCNINCTSCRIDFSKIAHMLEYNSSLREFGLEQEGLKNQNVKIVLKGLARNSVLENLKLIENLEDYDPGIPDDTIDDTEDDMVLIKINKNRTLRHLNIRTEERYSNLKLEFPELIRNTTNLKTIRVYQDFDNFPTEDTIQALKFNNSFTHIPNAIYGRSAKYYIELAGMIPHNQTLKRLIVRFDEELNEYIPLVLLSLQYNDSIRTLEIDATDSAHDTIIQLLIEIMKFNQCIETIYLKDDRELPDVITTQLERNRNTNRLRKRLLFRAADVYARTHLELSELIPEEMTQLLKRKHYKYLAHNLSIANVILRNDQ